MKYGNMDVFDWNIKTKKHPDFFLYPKYLICSILVPIVNFTVKTLFAKSLHYFQGKL